MASSPWLLFCNRGLLAIYTIEIALRVYTYRGQLPRRDDALWNLLDGTIVVVGWTCELLTERVAFVSAFRLLRMMRILRTLHLILMVRELHLMVNGIIGALKAVVWSSIILGIVITLWSLIAVEVLHPINRELEHASSCGWCPT